MTLRARETAFSPDNPFGLPFDPATGQPLPVSGNNNFLESGSFIDERFEASLAMQGKRTTLTLTGSIRSRRVRTMTRKALSTTWISI